MSNLYNNHDKYISEKILNAYSKIWMGAWKEEESDFRLNMDNSDFFIDTQLTAVANLMLTNGVEDVPAFLEWSETQNNQFLFSWSRNFLMHFLNHYHENPDNSEMTKIVNYLNQKSDEYIINNNNSFQALVSALKMRAENLQASTVRKIFSAASLDNPKIWLDNKLFSDFLPSAFFASHPSAIEAVRIALNSDDKYFNQLKKVRGRIMYRVSNNTLDFTIYPELQMRIVKPNIKKNTTYLLAYTEFIKTPSLAIEKALKNAFIASILEFENEKIRSNGWKEILEFRKRYDIPIIKFQLVDTSLGKEGKLSIRKYIYQYLGLATESFGWDNSISLLKNRIKIDNQLDYFALHEVMNLIVSIDGKILFEKEFILENILKLPSNENLIKERLRQINKVIRELIDHDFNAAFGLYFSLITMMNERILPGSSSQRNFGYTYNSTTEDIIDNGSKEQLNQLLDNLDSYLNQISTKIIEYVFIKKLVGKEGLNKLKKMMKSKTSNPKVQKQIEQHIQNDFSQEDIRWPQILDILE